MILEIRVAEEYFFNNTSSIQNPKYVVKAPVASTNTKPVCFYQTNVLLCQDNMCFVSTLLVFTRPHQQGYLV